MTEVVANALPTPVIAPSARDAARAAQVRAATLPATVGMVAVVVCLVFDAYVLAPTSDRTLFWPWLTLMALTPAAFFICAVVHRLRRPSDAEIVAVWIPVSRFFRVVLDIGVIVSPWVVLAGAEPLLRALMLMLYIWFIAVQVLANDDPRGMSWIACFGLPGSVGAFLLTHDAAYAAPLTGFFVLTGMSLFLLRQHIQRGRNRAFEAKLLFDALAEQPPALPASSAAATAPEPQLPRDGLTRRQIEVVRLIADGQSNKDIARTLGVSPATVKTHVAQIIAITGAANRTGASMRARDLGLV